MTHPKSYYAILLLIILYYCPIDSYAVDTNAVTRLDLAAPKLKDKRWTDAINVLKFPEPTPNHSMVNYLLAVCHSKLNDPINSMRYALDSLSAKPQLVEPYATASKNLIRWAGIEQSRPKIEITFQLSEVDGKGKDYLKERTRKEKIDKQIVEFESLKKRAEIYVDWSTEISEARLFDVCWEPSPQCSLSEIDASASDKSVPSAIGLPIPPPPLPTP